MANKIAHYELVVNRYYELLRWTKSIDPLFQKHLKLMYFYVKIGDEFGYRPHTIRRILMYEVFGVERKKPKKGGKK